MKCTNVPTGWQTLEVGRMVKPDDMFFGKYTESWMRVRTYGHKVTDEEDAVTYIRRIHSTPKAKAGDE